VPITAHICGVLRERKGHQAPRMRFEIDLATHSQDATSFRLNRRLSLDANQFRLSRRAAEPVLRHSMGIRRRSDPSPENAQKRH
jgi:hypothetical protein